MNGKILFYIFGLSLHVEQPTVDYLVLPSSELTMFRYTWQIVKLNFLENYISNKEILLPIFLLFFHKESPCTCLACTLYSTASCNYMQCDVPRWSSSFLFFFHSRRSYVSRYLIFNLENVTLLKPIFGLFYHQPKASNANAANSFEISRFLPFPCHRNTRF